MKYRHLYTGFGALAVLLSDVMCAQVAFSYANLWWSGRAAGGSAPPSVAFLLAIPYGIAIALCVLLSWVFYRRGKRGFGA